ncbi:MAG: DegV family protein [Lachnospiraceae bacterium]|nr:DegV family protein [Lachnospiraceae bacterium]
MIRIISDSTSDLSGELKEKYNIEIIPLHVVMGEQEYLDGVNITPDDIYKWADANKTTPKTSAAAINDCISVMKPIIDAGDEIVAFAISDSMSASGRVMKLAAEEIGATEKVTVIDSMNLSTGIGHLVIEAAEMAAAGLSRSEIEAKIKELIPRVRASFVVDTLVYLARGGRCSSVAAMMGSVLKLHPMIVVENGAMSATKKYRGKIDKVVIDYTKDLESELLKAKPDRVFITHSGCDRELVEAVRSYLTGLGRFKEVIETRAGGVISSHCGPGTLGVLFIAG